MKKLLFRFFIWVSFLLLSGYSNVYAHTPLFESQAKNLQEHFLNDVEKVPYSIESIVTDSHAATFKQNDKTELTDSEDEEEESVSFKVAPAKKQAAISNYFTSAFNTKAPGYFYAETKKRIPAAGPIFLFPSQRLHVIFRVFRI